MKRFFLLLFSFLLFALPARVSLPVQAAEEYHWFFQPAADARPVMPPEGAPDPGEGVVMIGPDTKRVFLTFDAGYINENVLKITETLEQFEVPAAFFILKQVVCENADLLTRWDADGFLICNHTLSHKNLARVSEETIRSEIEGLGTLYQEQTGKTLAPFFRPPEGSYNETVLSAARSLGYHTVFWSAAYADWDNDHQMPESEALALMLRRTHNGAVILLHPTSATNAAVLARYLTALKTAGYSFGSLEEFQ